jgi:hypothetical protein
LSRKGEKPPGTTKDLNAAKETVKTVDVECRRCHTSLKRGVNEISKFENPTQSALETGEDVTAGQDISPSGQGTDAVRRVYVDLFFGPIDPPHEANAVIEVAIEFAVNLLESITGRKHFNGQVWRTQKKFVWRDKDFFEPGFAYE